MTRTFTMLVVPREDGLGSEDELHLDQVAALRHELDEVGVTVVTAGYSDGKGTELVVPLIETVITGGAGLAAIGFVVRDWIRRRGRRTVNLVLKDGDRDVSVEMSAKNITDETLLKVMKDIIDG